MFKKLLEKIARILDGHGIPYMVVGGQALLVYGEPRLTKDIDVTLGEGIEALPAMTAALEEMGLKPLPDEPEEFLKKTMVLPCVDVRSGIRIDFIFSYSVYERQAIDRARSIEVEGSRVKFASLEDLIIHKVVAGRPRDIEDIRSVMIKNPGYDEKYIERWLKEFDRSLNGGFLESFKAVRKTVD